MGVGEEARHASRPRHEGAAEEEAAATVGAAVRTVGRAGTDKEPILRGLLLKTTTPTASRWDAVSFCATLPAWKFPFTAKSRRWIFHHLLWDPAGTEREGFWASPVGDAETSHRSCRIGSARLDGMGRAPSSRNCHHRGHSFRVRAGCDWAGCLCLAIGRSQPYIAEQVSQKIRSAAPAKFLAARAVSVIGVLRLRRKPARGLPAPLRMTREKV